MHEIVTGTPPDDRTGRVFPGVTPAVVQNVMTRACKNAGIPHYHPHDLRHRWISVQHKRGVPTVETSARVGHSRPSLTWDTYTHVIVDD
jgi:integrase